MSVHGYLVTAGPDSKMALWAASAGYTNWLEGRENGARETWQVMCFDEDLEAFLGLAGEAGCTVEEIVGAGDNETYALRVGEPGSGWAKTLPEAPGA